MTIKHELRKVLWNAGYDVVEYSPTSHKLARRKQLLNSFGTDLVLDIGANVGQFARVMRNDIGFTKRILSFEPLSAAFGLLRSRAENDPNWEVFNFAIGDKEERSEINISENSLSSSILGMLPSHVKSAPDSSYIGKETIEIKTLDSLFDDLCGSAGNIYMKIDTQGFESRVLKGAERCLPRIDTVQMELSLVPLYQGELLFDEMWSLMKQKGYTLVAIENGFSDPETGQILQADGIFHRFGTDAKAGGTTH